MEQNLPDPLRRRADLTILLLCVFWGASFVIVKDALAAASPFVFLSVRFAMGAVVATALAGRDLGHRPSLVAGLRQAPLLFGGFAFQTTGLAFTTPARSAFLTGLGVVFVPVFSVALYRRLPSRWTLAGLALAAAGLPVFTHVLGDAPAGSTLLGDVLTLGCAASFSLHQTLNERLARGAKPMAMVAVQLWIVALLSGAACLFTEVRLDPKPSFFAAAAVCAVFGSAFAYALQTWAQQHTTAIRAALIFSLEPVFATAFSLVLGRETLDTASLVGGALMVAGVVLAEVMSNRA